MIRTRRVGKVNVLVNVLLNSRRSRPSRLVRRRPSPAPSIGGSNSKRDQPLAVQLATRHQITPAFESSAMQCGSKGKEPADRASALDASLAAPHKQSADLFAGVQCNHPSSLSALPSDILGLIFARFPTRPLLSVLSLVCKRWRKCALNAVTSLRVTGRLRADLVALLPSLTDLIVYSSSSFWPPAEAAPTSLRRLAIRGDWDLHAIEAAHLQLQVFCHGGVQSGNAWRIVQDNRTSLTSLYLSTLLSYESCSLPALVSLSLHALEPCIDLPMLLVSHASQLTSLRLSRGVSHIVHAGASFPRLRHLHFAVFRDGDGAALAALAQRTPTLTSLCVEVGNRDAILLGPLATLLTGLELSAVKEETYAALSALCFPRLRSLHILNKAEALGAEKLIASLSGTLEEVSVTTSGVHKGQWLEALAACKNLATLHLRLRYLADQHVSYIASVRMPALHTLAIKLFIDSDVEVIHALQAFVTAAPRLRRIHTDNSLRHDVESFAEFVDRAEQAGVEEILVFSEDKPIEGLVRKRTRWLDLIYAPCRMPTPSRWALDYAFGDAATQ